MIQKINKKKNELFLGKALDKPNSFNKRKIFHAYYANIGLEALLLLTKPYKILICAKKYFYNSLF